MREFKFIFIKCFIKKNLEMRGLLENNKIKFKYIFFVDVKMYVDFLIYYQFEFFYNK